MNILIGKFYKWIKSNKGKIILFVLIFLAILDLVVLLYFGQFDFIELLKNLLPETIGAIVTYLIIDLFSNYIEGLDIEERSRGRKTTEKELGNIIKRSVIILLYIVDGDGKLFNSTDLSSILKHLEEKLNINNLRVDLLNKTKFRVGSISLKKKLELDVKNLSSDIDRVLMIYMKYLTDIEVGILSDIRDSKFVEIFCKILPSFSETNGKSLNIENLNIRNENLFQLFNSMNLVSNPNEKQNHSFDFFNHVSELEKQLNNQHSPKT